MNHHTFLRLSLAAALAATGVAQSPLTIGNLVVVSVTAGSNTSAVTLDEYTPGGTFVQSVPLPAVASGANRQFTIRGNASSEGYLNVSANGLYLTLAGYDAPVGTPGATIESSTSATFPRVVARVDLTGSVDTTTALVDAYDGSATVAGNVRAAASLDGNSFWLSGTGTGGTSGVRHVGGLGASSSTLLNQGAPTNCRVVGIYDSQLYTTSASTVFLGVCTVGTGVPTQAGQPITLLTGFPTTGGTAAGSSYDFFFADQNTVYVCDDNAPASTVGGISKWTWNGTQWDRAYRLTVNPTSTSNWGARAITGFTRDGVTTLWATMNTGSGTGTVLCSVVDTGPTSTVTQLISSPSGTAFRGVRYLAKPSSITRIAASCGGTADIKVAGNGEIGTDVRTTILTPSVLPLVVYGTSNLGLPIDPACTCLLGPSLDVLVASGTSTLSIPNQSALVGLVVYTQGIDLFAPGGCQSPFPTTLTDYFAITVQ
jgi:hypothetical protein